MLNDKPFKKVKGQIGFCGIWCGSCVAGNGTLKELTKKYEKVIRSYSLEEWAPKDFDFKEFLKGLTSIQSMPLCHGCLNSGGRENCEMRDCALNKKIDDCSECQNFNNCKHIEILQKMRSGALEAGLFVKTENVDKNMLIDKWTIEMQKKWPCFILFMNDL